MAMGRPQKPYQTSWGDIIPGLYRCPDRRWRINVTGEKFTEPDGRRAVQRFRDRMMVNRPAPVIQWPTTLTPNLGPVMPVTSFNGKPVTLDSALMLADVVADSIQTSNAKPCPADEAHEDSGAMPRWEPASVPEASYLIPESDLWPWLREQLIVRPEYVAKMTGIPELTGLRHLPIPKPPLKLDDLIAVYRQKSPSTDKAKTRCVTIFRKMMEHTGATTLEDLSTEKLSDYCDRVETDPDITSAGTKTWMYGQIKSLLAFGLKVGLDTAQLKAALDRCKVLWTPDAMPNLQPAPISREDFHTLLATAGTGPWRAWLLVGLNFGMHMIDVAAGTFACIRNKKRRERVPRAAVLWPETSEAIRPFLGKPYLFTSPTGTRYNVNSRCNELAKLRAKAGLPKTVTFDGLRDAAHTAACQARSDDKWARVLCGQRADGLQDNYVLRNPACVRPACDAVYAAYGPF